MGVKVVKFGGTSLADAIHIEKTKNIIEKDPDRKYVVVSAPGKRFDEDNKITDLLYLCKTHLDHNLDYEQIFQTVEERFEAVKRKLNIDVDLDHYFSEINENIRNGVSTDYIASRGEFLSAVILSSYLGYDLVDTADLIVFDNKGNLKSEETDRNLREELARHERVVLPGFYGTDEEGNIVTFSRGGSDVTGALVAKAIGADMYENWTDVSGLLMADPRIVKNPKPMEKVSYKELRELSYMGAKVLHEDSIFPAREANIPINIRNTNRPDDEGTYITSDNYFASDDSVVKGIAGCSGFTSISIYKSMLSGQRGFIRKVTEILEDFDISLEHIPNGIDTVSIIISNEQLGGRLDDLVDMFEKRLNPDSIEVYDDLALIATVGLGMAKRPGTAATLFKALYDENINIKMIDQGSSELNIIVGVDGKELNKAINAIYDAFVQ